MSYMQWNVVLSNVYNRNAGNEDIAVGKKGCDKGKQTGWIKEWQRAVYLG